MPEKLRTLQSFPDFILFKGSLETVAAEGRFGRDWRLTAADSEKMRASGAILVP